MESIIAASSSIESCAGSITTSESFPFEAATNSSSSHRTRSAYFRRDSGIAGFENDAYSRKVTGIPGSAAIRSAAGEIEYARSELTSTRVFHVPAITFKQRVSTST